MSQDYLRFNLLSALPASSKGREPSRETSKELDGWILHRPVRSLRRDSVDRGADLLRPIRTKLQRHSYDFLIQL